MLDEKDFSEYLGKSSEVNVMKTIKNKGSHSKY